MAAKLVFCGTCKYHERGRDTHICLNEKAYIMEPTPIRMAANRDCTSINESNDCDFFEDDNEVIRDVKI